MDLNYRPRWMAAKLREAVEFSPAVVLTGARQTGKSTLLRHELPFKEWPYLTLDDLEIREMAERDPARLAGLYDRVVIDEVQKAPSLLAAVKRQIDRDRSRRFVLSGSANLLLMQNVTETLAGRCLYFDLLPFSIGEENGRPPGGWTESSYFRQTACQSDHPAPIPDSALYRGYLPPVCSLAKESHVADWWLGYTRTYLERDLRSVSQVTNLADFRKIMSLLSSSTAQILNQANISRASRVSQPTVGRYLNLLETTGLFFRLSPYSRNVRKRVVKSPKLFCVDTGLACSLAGLKSSKALVPEHRGRLFETLAFHNLLARTAIEGGSLYHLRTQGGMEREVDFVLETAGRFVTIEVKAAATAEFKDADPMLQLKDLLPSWSHGIVIYNGREVRKLADHVWAMPAALI